MLNPLCPLKSPLSEKVDMRIAGIDQGTTSTRTIAINSEGQPDVLHSLKHHQVFPKAGWVEQDPEELIQNIQCCIDAAGKLDAIGIDNQGESCLAWDAETKEALSSVISWQDSRTLAVLDRMKSDGVGAEVQRRAGLPLDPYFSASKLSWIVYNIPKAQDALKRGTLRLGTTDAFFLERLTGKFITDVTTASRTSLMNLETLEWDQTLCDIFNVPLQCLPSILPTTGNFGAMKTEYGSTPVTASVVDQQAALYGFGCRRKGQTKITFGTGAFALMLTGDKIILQPEFGLLPTVAWQFEDEPAIYALDGGVFTAGSAINWARSLNLFNRYDEINAFHFPPAISTGLVFVPALAGLGCPHWDARARGAWLGVSLEHTNEQMVQSILEGVAFRTSEVIESMNRCIPIGDELYVDGGMSTNPYFTQFLADTTGLVILSAKVPELTGLGTILLACQALGYKPKTAFDYGRYNPNSLPTEYLSMFQSAVATSLDWIAFRHS